MKKSLPPGPVFDERSSAEGRGVFFPTRPFITRRDTHFTLPLPSPCATLITRALTRVTRETVCSFTLRPIVPSIFPAFFPCAPLSRCVSSLRVRFSQPGDASDGAACPSHGDLVVFYMCRPKRKCHPRLIVALRGPHYMSPRFEAIMRASSPHSQERCSFTRCAR